MQHCCVNDGEMDCTFIYSRGWLARGLFLYLLSGMASFQIQIAPKHIQADPLGVLQVRCSADPVQPISACQFRIWYVGKQEQGVLLNVSRSEEWQTERVKNPYHDGNYTAQLFKRSDKGDGFCDIRLHGLRGDHLLVGCKLTAVSGLSAVGTMSVFSHSGGTVKIFVNSHNKNKLTATNGSPPRFTPLGDLLSQGQCGFTISNVTEEDSGVFFVLARGEDGSVGAKAVTLVVQKHPCVTVSLSKDAKEFDVGDVVTVTCTASGVRQNATRLSWGWWNATTKEYDDIAPAQAAFSDTWSWPWEDSISQSLILTLKGKDHGKELRCKAEGADIATLIPKKGKNITIKGMVPPMSKPKNKPIATTKIPPATTLATATISTSQAPPDAANAEPPAETDSTALDQPISSGGVTWLIIGAVAGLVAVLVVTACLVFAFLKKLACFRDRVSESLVQYSANLAEAQQQSHVITPHTSQPKGPEPKPRAQKKVAPAKPTPKTRHPTKPEPKTPKSSNPREGQPLRPPAQNHEAAQSDGAARSGRVLYAKLANVKATPAQAKKLPTSQEEVLYTQLLWDK